MMKLLILIFFFITAGSSSSFGGTCQPIDLRKDQWTGPAKSQGKTSFCYAYSSAYLLSLYYNTNISGLALGIKNEFINIDTDDEWLSPLEPGGNSKHIYGSGGRAHRVLKQIQPEQLCLDSEFPSATGDNRVDLFVQEILEQKHKTGKSIRRVFMAVHPADISTFKWSWLNRANSLINLNSNMKVYNELIETNLLNACLFSDSNCHSEQRIKIAKFLDRNHDKTVYLLVSGDHSEWQNLADSDTAPGFMTETAFKLQNIQNQAAQNDFTKEIKRIVVTKDVLADVIDQYDYPDRPGPLANLFSKKCAKKYFKRDYRVRTYKENAVAAVDKINQLLLTGNAVEYSYFTSGASSHSVVIVGQDKECNYLVRDSGRGHDYFMTRTDFITNYIDVTWLEPAGKR